jgi:hypothetical protein
MTTLYDSTNASLIPSNVTLMAGYINGRWPSYFAMKARFPSATILSITITIDQLADILDIESGDASPSQAPIWVVRMRASNRKPTLYCSRLGTWPATIAALKSANVAPPDYWIADYTGQPHLVPGSVATQWTDFRNLYDISQTNGYWPSSIHTPPPIIPPIQNYPVGDKMISIVAVLADSNGNGDLHTSIPWSTFQAATIQGSDPEADIPPHWPGYCQVQERDGNILVSIINCLPNVVRNVFVLTSS